MLQTPLARRSLRNWLYCFCLVVFKINACASSVSIVFCFAPEGFSPLRGLGWFLVWLLDCPVSVPDCVRVQRDSLFDDLHCRTPGNDCPDFLQFTRQAFRQRVRVNRPCPSP